MKEIKEMIKCLEELIAKNSDYLNEFHAELPILAFDMGNEKYNKFVLEWNKNHPQMGNRPCEFIGEMNHDADGNPSLNIELNNTNFSFNKRYMYSFSSFYDKYLRFRLLYVCKNRLTIDIVIPDVLWRNRVLTEIGFKIFNNKSGREYWSYNKSLVDDYKVKDEQWLDYVKKTEARDDYDKYENSFRNNDYHLSLHNDCELEGENYNNIGIEISCVIEQKDIITHEIRKKTVSAKKESLI